jgi:hypothetical protein
MNDRCTVQKSTKLLCNDGTAPVVLGGLCAETRTCCASSKRDPGDPALGQPLEEMLKFHVPIRWKSALTGGERCLMHGLVADLPSCFG